MTVRKKKRCESTALQNGRRRRLDLTPQSVTVSFFERERKKGQQMLDRGLLLWSGVAVAVTARWPCWSAQHRARVRRRTSLRGSASGGHRSARSASREGDHRPRNSGRDQYVRPGSARAAVPISGEGLG